MNYYQPITNNIIAVKVHYWSIKCRILRSINSDIQMKDYKIQDIIYCSLFWYFFILLWFFIISILSRVVLKFWRRFWITDEYIEYIYLLSTYELRERTSWVYELRPKTLWRSKSVCVATHHLWQDTFDNLDRCWHPLDKEG